MFHIVCWQSILPTDHAVLGSCTSGSASIWSFNQRRALGRPRSWPLAWSNAYGNGDGSSYGWNYMKRLGESTSSYTSYNLGDRLGGGPIWEGSGANQWGYRLSLRMALRLPGKVNPTETRAVSHTISTRGWAKNCADGTTLRQLKTVGNYETL